jgi:hypothetical protein
MKLVEDLKEGDILYAYNVEEDISDYKLEIYSIQKVKRFRSWVAIEYIPIVGESNIPVDFPPETNLDAPVLVTYDYEIHTIYTTKYENMEHLIKEDENFPYLQSQLSFYFDSFYDIWEHETYAINELVIK